MNFEQYFKYRHNHDTLANNRFKNWISIEYYIVEAMVEGKKTAVGMFGLYTVTWSSDRAIWLDWLAVDPKFKQRGIGSSCLDLAKRIARSNNGLVLCVESSPRYKIARELFLNHEFELKINVDDYFEDGDPLHVYAIEL